MMYIIWRTLAVLAASYITHVGVPLTHDFAMVKIAFFFAVVFAIINHTIKPLVSIVLTPITVLTLGLLTFVINGAMVLLAARFVADFIIPNFWMAIVYALVLAVVNAVIHVIERIGE